MGLIVESQPYSLVMCTVLSDTSANIESLVIQHECRADPPTFKTLSIRDVEVACCLARARMPNACVDYFPIRRQLILFTQR